LCLGTQRDTLCIANNQIGCPTSEVDLVHLVLSITAALAQNRNCFGFHHYSGTGPVIGYEFAETAFTKSGDSTDKVHSCIQISTKKFGAPVQKLVHYMLDCIRIEAILGISAHPWKVELAAVPGDIRTGKASAPITIIKASPS
jgi:dTDP-4-dehydrorhamnose reductase